MRIHLLDANVLIALVAEDHEHHARVSAWAASAERLALCAVVEGALVRFLVRLGEHPQAALEVLRRLHAHERVEVWTESPSYVEVDLSHVHGHRQVTDAYLAALAQTRSGGVLATLDGALAAALPDATVLVPPLT